MSDLLDSDSAPSKFRTTAWSVVAKAQNPESDDYEQSIAYLCKAYWRPIFNYMRRRGLDTETANDLTQEYFSLFLAKNYIETVDKNKGRFRTFILTTISRFLSKYFQKAKKYRKNVPLNIVYEDDDAEHVRVELSDDHTAEDEFNQLWAKSLIEKSFEKMSEQCLDGNQKLYYEVFSLYIESATDVEPKSYRDISKELDITETDMTNYLHRGRNIFQKILRDEVRQSVMSEDEVDQEIEELRKYFI
ncbi:MAG: RNA polymerase sigma factor [Planctomycetota bacterium]|jgi:RNA polymerase sigma-70 factor (ECF subfamily)